jgi:hypothetical protein
MVPPFSCNTRFKGGWKMKNRSIILQAVKHLSVSFFAKNKYLSSGKSAILAFSVVTILLFNGCESLPEGPDNIWNELDPASPDYVKPNVTFMGRTRCRIYDQHQRFRVYLDREIRPI